MPNWCSNTVCLQHEDPAMITRALTAYNDDRFLEEFIPVPDALKETISGSLSDPTEQEKLEARRAANIKNYGHADWYDFCVNEWGTKWDVGASGGSADTSTDGRVLSISFDSAWAPPLAAYEKLMDQGFSVYAMYYESGCAFAGVWDNGDDEYFDLSGLDYDEVRNMLPSELDSTFSISDDMEEWARQEEDEVTSWYKDGVEETGLEPHILNNKETQ